MAWSDFFAGGGGVPTGSGTAGGGSVGNINYAQVSPTSDPSFANLLNEILQVTPRSLPGINDIVSGGMNSPLLQLVLGPALQRLQAPQAAQREQLTEATRAAGGLRGSQYGKAYTRLQQQQGQQQNDLMAQVIQQMLGPLISGSLQAQQNAMLPGRSLTDVLRTIAPQTVTGAGSSVSGGGGGGGWANIPASQGLNTPMAGDRMASTAGRGGFGTVAAPTGPSFYDNPANRWTASPAPAPGAPYTPYLDPFGGGSGGFPITSNPYTGSYETYNPNPSGIFTPEQGGPTPGYEVVTEGWW